MLFVHNDVVAEILTMEDCIAVQEKAFRDLAAGRAAHRPRSDIYAPCEREDGYYRWGTTLPPAIPPWAGTTAIYMRQMRS